MSSTDTPAVLENPPEDDTAEDQAAVGQWVETALTVLFTAVAVLFVSFVAVVTGLV
jgi:hypothetical protein